MVELKMLSQPKIGSRWKHWKNHKTYTVRGFAVFCDIDHEERLLVIYEDDEGGSWARSQYEWHNTVAGGARRFEEVD